MAEQMTNQQTINVLKGLLEESRYTAATLAQLTAAINGTGFSSSTVGQLCQTQADRIVALQQRIADLVEIRIAGAYDDSPNVR